MTTDSNRERMLAKVRKLMNFGNDARGNEHEMEAALRQAAKIMAEYGIDEAEANMAALDKGSMSFGEVYTTADGTDRAYRQVRRYAQYLAVGVAEFTETIASIAHDPQMGAGLMFRGEKNDVLMAKWLFSVMVEEVRKATQAARKEYDSAEFRRACAARVAQRLKAAAEEKNATIKAAAASGSRALVVIDRKKQEIVARFGKAKYKDSRTRKFTAASVAGREAGDRININRNRPIEGGRAAARISKGA